MADDIGVAEGFQLWVPGTGQDPARYLIPPKFWLYQRPSLQGEGHEFIWPAGLEGFQRSGQAQIAIYHYLGDDEVHFTVMHKNESRIQMNGTFPGTTSPDYMEELIATIKADDPVGHPGKILTLPGVFESFQHVAVESYEFGHDPGDLTHSITYIISFVLTHHGKRLGPEETGEVPPPQPGAKTTPRGSSTNVFKVRDGYRTFRAIAKLKYGDAGKWRRLVDLNRNLIKGMPVYKIPYHRWPIGQPVKF